MFAKLKKKIEEETGSSPGPSDGEKRHGPGLASPVTSPTSLYPPGSVESSPRLPSLSDESLVETATQAPTNGTDSALEDSSGSGESTLLVKRTEQVKKLERKVAELASMIKEKNRAIERLEIALEKQQDLTAKRMQELNEQYQASRVKMSVGLSQNAQQQNEKLEEELKKAVEAKKELEEQLLFLHQKSAQHEEHTDELHGFSTQEMAKVKHMLLNTESELQSCQAALGMKTEALDESQQQCSHLSSEVDNLIKQISSLTYQSDSVDEENRSLKQQLEEVTEQNARFQLNLTSLTAQLAQRSKKLSVLQHKYSELSSEYEALQRTMTMLRHNTKSRSDEQDESLLQATERIKILEGRLQDSCLEGDEQTVALQRERNELEKREEDLKQRLSGLEHQLAQLESQRAEDRKLHSQTQAKLRELEASHAEWLEQEIDAEKRISSLEEQLQATKVLEGERHKELDELQLLLKSKESQLSTLCSQVEDLRKSTEELKARNSDLLAMHKTSQQHLSGAEKEKNTLLLRNATLSQELNSLRQQSEDADSQQEQMIQQQRSAITGLELSLGEYQQQLAEAQAKVQQAEESQLAGAHDSSHIENLSTKLKSVEDQLNDKNKTIRMQQQRLSDLKKTLQRELKVQALPNDEPLSDSEYLPRSVARPLSETRSSSALGLNSAIVSCSPAVLQLSSANSVTSAVGGRNNSMERTGASSQPPPRQTKGPFNHLGDYDYTQDVNLEYLKHVVMKFVLSRESEALQLIKAISMLLKFTPDEQVLIRDTLEYKRSWFGTRPSLGSGQKSKVIPHSYY